LLRAAKLIAQSPDIAILTASLWQWRAAGQGLFGRSRRFDTL
jgi:hypothetical protein